MPKNLKHSLNITPPKAVGIGTAHGKIILMGEHSVVYDYPAIAIPFPAVEARVTITASEFDEHYVLCPYYTGPMQKMPKALKNLQSAIQLTLQSIKTTVPPMQFFIGSNIPQERGMGSSAAVATAIVRAICDYMSVPLSDTQLRYIVNEAEVIAHDSTSGIDTLMTSSTKPVIYRKSQPPRAFSLNLDAYLIVADSGQTGETRAAVQQVANLLKEKPVFTKQSLEAMGQFVHKAYQAIERRDTVELGRLMTYNHYYLNRIGVSTPELDNIVNVAWLAGALGAKLTGGGFGGCVIALATSPLSARQIADSMREAGAIQTWTLPLELV